MHGGAACASTLALASDPPAQVVHHHLGAAPRKLQRVRATEAVAGACLRYVSARVGAQARTSDDRHATVEAKRCGRHRIE